VISNAFAKVNGHDAELAGVNMDSLGQAFEHLVQDYYAAKVDRYMPSPSGVRTYGSGADYHYRLESEFLRIMERSRLADRDNMVCSQGVNRLVANIFQGGFRLDPETGDPEVDAAQREFWNDWSTDPEACDYEGERTFHEFETVGFRGQVVDGDGVFLPTNRGSLQHFEAHRLRNPFAFRKLSASDQAMFVHGIELAANRRRAAYWLTVDEVEPAAAVRRENKSVRFATRSPNGHRQVFHVYSPKRTSQRRGVSALAPVMLPLNYHDDLQFATLVKAKVASYYAIIREREIGAPTGGSSPQRGAEEISTRTDGTTQRNQSGSPGQEVTGARGEKIKGFAPNIPNPEFFPHAELLLTFLAINLDLPMMVFLLDASKSNFSAWRGAIQQSRMRLRAMGREYVCKFHKPCYQWQTRRHLAASAWLRRKAKAGVDIFKHRWIPPRWEYIEPSKDAAAADLRLSSNQASYGQIATEQGMDLPDLVESVVDGREAFVLRAIESAEKINANLPAGSAERVSWRELAYGHKSNVDLTAAVVAGDNNQQGGTDEG